MVSTAAGTHRWYWGPSREGGGIRRYRSANVSIRTSEAMDWSISGANSPASTTGAPRITDDMKCSNRLRNRREKTVDDTEYTCTAAKRNNGRHPYYSPS